MFRDPASFPILVRLRTASSLDLEPRERSPIIRWSTISMEIHQSLPPRIFCSTTRRKTAESQLAATYSAIASFPSCSTPTLLAGWHPVTVFPLPATKSLARKPTMLSISAPTGTRSRATQSSIAHDPPCIWTRPAAVADLPQATTIRSPQTPWWRVSLPPSPLTAVPPARPLPLILTTRCHSSSPAPPPSALSPHDLCAGRPRARSVQQNKNYQKIPVLYQT